LLCNFKRSSLPWFGGHVKDVKFGKGLRRSKKKKAKNESEAKPIANSVRKGNCTDLKKKTIAVKRKNRVYRGEERNKSGIKNAEGNIWVKSKRKIESLEKRSVPKIHSNVG